MRFSASILALVASAAVSHAGKVIFWTLDDVQRDIYFDPSEGSSRIDSVKVSNKENTTVEFPDVWVGNFYAIPEGKEKKPGMLGEVNFSGWIGLTYFDVSAIVDPNDHQNVKQMWPVDTQTPMSGCEVFPCDNAYWLPDDVQTKVTKETTLMTTLGSGSTGLKFV
ncbi:hypothetical protein CDD81_7769 [Ophiocordyceps australis]|uniref:DNase1 protein n=1 Tax=Ophiocordyceps australis TaxID=1399860 RepID=A0A2C5XXD0_9HYPO|nr:hypothetical protein CDD81_7769 [Ophiocordyceps australis]